MSNFLEKLGQLDALLGTSLVLEADAWLEEKCNEGWGSFDPEQEPLGKCDHCSLTLASGWTCCLQCIEEGEAISLRLCPQSEKHTTDHSNCQAGSKKISHKVHPVQEFSDTPPYPSNTVSEVSEEERFQQLRNQADRLLGAGWASDALEDNTTYPELDESDNQKPLYPGAISCSSLIGKRALPDLGQMIPPPPDPILPVFPTHPIFPAPTPAPTPVPTPAPAYQAFQHYQAYPNSQHLSPPPPPPFLPTPLPPTLSTCDPRLKKPQLRSSHSQMTPISVSSDDGDSEVLQPPLTSGVLDRPLSPGNEWVHTEIDGI